MHYLANVPGIEHFLAKDPPSGHKHYLANVPGHEYFLAKDPPSGHKHFLANVSGHEHYLSYQRKAWNRYSNCLLVINPSCLTEPSIAIF